MKTKKSSVLIIGINFHPEPTGIGKYTGELGFYLSQNDFNVDVITGFPYYPNWKVFDGYGNWFYSHQTVDGVNITRCPLYVPAKMTGLKRMLQDLTFFITAFFILLQKMLSFKQYDMLFVASPSFLSGFLGGLYRFFYRKTKFVYHIQDLQIDAAEELGMIKSNRLLKVMKYLERSILVHADWVTTISDGMQKRIAEKDCRLQRQYIFPNWVDFSTIKAKKPNLSVIKKLNIPVDKRLVFYSGAVGEKQGLEMILDTAQNAKAALPDVFFVIAGSGPYASVLKERAANQGLNNLMFIGLQELDVFNELLNFAFIHLVIQKDKASNLLLPSKLTNILAVGGLCIVTAARETSLHDIVAGNNLGIVTKPECTNALWDAIYSVCNDSDQVAELKKNAMIYASKYLRKESIIENFLEEVGIGSRRTELVPAPALDY
ncbi:WcaI family glycosyltransferase [Desertivirga arenae]|uniref:WcaI family glycosyltransferase n=1 Tax=Desertivirga arenae TaxID=2810309 RepID=UPI001A95990E|nr:WcaI family glycosyltransferase [Pedobacter sp. SYSU D00823]